MFLDAQTIANAGYVAIAIVIFAECGLLIGFFLPGDSLLFTAGFLASQRPELNIWVLCVVCGVAAAVGPLVGYWYGAWAGPKLFNREDSIWFHRKHLQRAHEFYERHGGKALVLARFMPIVRTFAPVVAGMAKMEYSSFVLYTIIGAVIWAVGVTWVGFFLGSLEYRTRTVQDLYRRFLQRDADPIGLNGWVAFLGQGGSAGAFRVGVGEFEIGVRSVYAGQGTGWGGFNGFFHVAPLQQ